MNRVSDQARLLGGKKKKKKKEEKKSSLRSSFSFSLAYLREHDTDISHPFGDMRSRVREFSSLETTNSPNPRFHNLIQIFKPSSTPIEFTPTVQCNGEGYFALVTVGGEHNLSVEEIVSDYEGVHYAEMIGAPRLSH